MRAVVHVSAGAVIVASISNPWISLPLAVVAHFALDALPHYGDIKAHRAQQLAEQRWAVPLDAFAGLVVLIAIILFYPDNSWLVALGGVLCAIIDLWHVPAFIDYVRNGNSGLPSDWLSRFHDKIQWCERRWGIAVELPFLVVMLYVLFANA